MKKLYRSRKNKMFCGVCAGIGEYFNIDPTMVRIAAVVLSVMAFAGVIAYIIGCFIIPEEPYGEI